MIIIGRWKGKLTRMVLIDIKISGLNLMQLLDYFDSRPELPPDIAAINDSLRRQFAAGIFQMKVDDFRDYYNMRGTTHDGIESTTEEGQETVTETTTTTRTTTTTTTEEPAPTRARSKKAKAAAARKRRRGVQGESFGIRRTVTLLDPEDESGEGEQQQNNNGGGDD